MDMIIPNIMDKIISPFIIWWDNSCPPLNPIAKSNYNDINLDEFGGISKSLFKYTAKIPKAKNSKAGFVKFSRRRFKFIIILIAI